MVIRYNEAALNGIVNLGILGKNQKKTQERLSSGYRINRAADDAAGLQISEKMRNQIRGLNQASKNALDGVSLVQVADGALDEVHSVVKRIRELAVQSANDTNENSDRQAIQDEIDELLKQVDKIGNDTDFNGIKLFDGSHKATESVSAASPYLAVDSISNNKIENLVNLIYSEDNNYEYTATQTPGSTATSAGYDKLKALLKDEIVPQAVTTLLNTYSKAFGYLNGSSIGIGLRLYTDGSSSVLASCATGLSGSYDSSGNLNIVQSYQLSVNMASLSFNADGSLEDFCRSELEATILHEFMHAMMYESTTNGMLGMTSSGTSSEANKYPLWFAEGMAQTTSGGYSDWNDWVNGGLGITSSTSVSSISSIVKSSGNVLTNTSSGRSSYGTGYLACMYLGFLASGKDLSQGNVTVSNIKSGVDTILNKLISGSSLDDVINQVSNGKYSSVSNFASSFGDSLSAEFISYLTKAVGSGNGSLVTGSFLSTDLLSDSSVSQPLFNLNTESTEVSNDYPDDVNVLSGGGATVGGNVPVDSYDEGDDDPPIDVDVSINIGSITVGSGDGYTFDGTTLTLTSDGTYKISGSKSGINIKVSDGTTTKINLSNANISAIGSSGITLGDGSNVELVINGINTITSDSGAAIKVGDSAKLTICGEGRLITMAGSGSKSAAIGSEAMEDAGDITIKGTSGKELVVIATSDTGVDGIGAGNGGTCSSIQKECGIIVENGDAGVYGQVTLSDTLNISGDMEVDQNASLTISKNGVITDNNSNVDIKNNGKIYNYGNIGGAVSNGETGSTVHYVSRVNLVKIDDIAAGDKLSDILDATCTISYNGGMIKNLSGNCTYKDSSGNVISDPSSVIVEKGQNYTLSQVFDLSTIVGEGILFSNDSTISESSSYIKYNSYMDRIGGLSDSVSMTGNSISSDGTTMTVSYAIGVSSSGGSGASTTQVGGLVLQVGAYGDHTMVLSIDEMNMTELGINSISVMSHQDASDTIDLCDDAITRVSDLRSRLGAYQCRLEDTISNVDNYSENLQAAESRIRDTDMAEEMMNYSKNNIIINAAQSLLSHSNQDRSSVLKLLE